MAAPREWSCVLPYVAATIGETGRCPPVGVRSGERTMSVVSDEPAVLTPAEPRTRHGEAAGPRTRLPRPPGEVPGVPGTRHTVPPVVQDTRCVLRRSVPPDPGPSPERSVPMRSAEPFGSVFAHSPSR
ncbi:hypothetical protein Sfulv_01590 [Streptomyces fulvorobeus]|uniref:Uncharacterized protein n=1 Tax=Streptomyces fulvorobeus TaxID=284028 RepID=A0A7J0BYN9_9ACTN|nr:hypothetical protein Sfulv_01590 [Streptomyces fulvorobeus]